MCRLWSLGACRTATFFFLCLSAIFLWTASSYRQPSAKFSLSHLRELLSVSSSVFATSLLWFVSSKLDQIAIGRFVGAPALGFYVIAGKLPDLANTLTQQPVTQVSLPALSRIQNDHARMRQVIHRGMKLNAPCLVRGICGSGRGCLGSCAVFFLEANGLLLPDCARYCRFMRSINSLQIFFYPALLASGGVGRYVLLNACHTISVLIACVIGIQFGVRCLVLGLIANGLVVTIPAIMFLRNRIGLSPLDYFKPCLAPAFASRVNGGSCLAGWKFAAIGYSNHIKIARKNIAGAVSYIGYAGISALNGYGSY